MAMRSLLSHPHHTPSCLPLRHLRASLCISRLLDHAPTHKQQQARCRSHLPRLSSVFPQSLRDADTSLSLRHPVRALSSRCTAQPSPPSSRRAPSSAASGLASPKGSTGAASKRVWCSSESVVSASDSIISIETQRSSKPKKAGSQKLKSKPKIKPKLQENLTFNVPVILEDSLDSTPQLEVLLEQLERDGPLAVKLAVEGLDDKVSSGIVELSLLICDDAYIRNLNKEWRGDDSSTDVLSFPQEQPPGVSSLWLLGDVIISLDTAKRQAQERGHGLLDEVRILLVHGLLHVLGFDHEEGPKAAADMEKEELRILQGLGWNGKGLITATSNGTLEEHRPSHDESKEHAVKSKGLWKRKPLFKVLLCDMDGTLLNSKSRITEKTAAALKEAIERGVKVFIATGKTRPAVITACQSVGLVGEMGVVSESSPGVFVQGLLVYGQHGKVVHSQLLSQDVCIKAFQYSLEQKMPLLGFSGDRIVTLFDHPLIENLHTTYMEPKAEVAPSLEYLIENFQIQKLLFASTAEQILKVVRPYWSKEVGDLARCVQAQDDMLEIIPPGSSKGKGVAILLENLGVHPDDVMAIGDGENDIEMLELAGWGVAMGNAVAPTFAVADARVASNNEDGVVEALERFVLSH